jgi:hypothetical protein
MVDSFRRSDFVVVVVVVVVDAMADDVREGCR